EVFNRMHLDRADPINHSSLVIFFRSTHFSRHDAAAVVTNSLPTRIPSFEMGSNSRRGHAPRCSTVAHDFSGRSQASQILRVKCAQGGCDRGPNAKDSFFHAWAEQRDPKLAANK